MARQGSKQGRLGSGGRTVRHLGRNPRLLGKDLVRGTRRDRGPALAGPDGFAQAQEELLLRVIALPASALIERDEIGFAPLCQGAPFQRALVGWMRGGRGGHGGAVASRSCAV